SIVVPTRRPTNYARNVLHFGSALLAMAIVHWLLSPTAMLVVGGALATWAWSMEAGRRVHPAVNRFLMWVLGPFAHPHESYRVNSATWYCTALFLLALFGSKLLVLVAIGVLGFADPMPTAPPRLDRATEGMGVWVVGAEPTGDFAASAYDRIVIGSLRGRPADVDGDTARRVISAVADLAADGTPVVHDISNGGLAVALSEIAIRSGIGFTLDDLDASALFDETPLRAIVVADAAPDTPIACTRIGTMGGDALDFGSAGSLLLAEATAIWTAALPRRMA
ncbi:MAG: hypothetical protein KDB69_00660, partial [Acidimicrobiia bacterium]|nr:hypothetical protein [Acidimicrobiia bacterium]